MTVRRRWTFPAFTVSDLDRQILGLCAPRALLPPMWVNPERLLERAAALDVFPLVFHRLRHAPRGLPPNLSATWEERFRANAARNLYLHSERQRLLGALAAAGVRAVPLKGTMLAEQAYGDLALRTQTDIDLYVPPEELPAALGLLEASDYARLAPLGLRPEEFAATGDEFTSECSLESHRPGLRVLLELHWRILPTGGEELEAALAAGSGQPLPPELNFLYLCLHLAADRWGTLKSLTDVAHWWVRQVPDWERVLAAAERFRLRRVVYVTLAALDNYFDVPIPDAVRARLEAACPRSLPRQAVANPLGPPTFLRPAITHYLRLALRDGFFDRLHYAAHLLRPTARDLAVVRLPRSLGFLRWGLRWLRAAGLLGHRMKSNHVVVQE